MEINRNASINCPPCSHQFLPRNWTSKMHKKKENETSNPLTHNRFMNNDLNHNLVCRNGNTIKTTFHGARQREAVQQLTYEQRIQSCACVRGGGRRRARRERGFEWNAFRIMRHVRIPRVRLRGNEGNGEQVGSRVSPLEIRHERCADVCSEKCLVVAPPRIKINWF